MSYRTIKRVLGETSLERKCRFLFGGGLVLLISGSFFLYGKLNTRLIANHDREQARALVVPRLQSIHWAAEQKATTGDGSSATQFLATLDKGVVGTLPPEADAETDIGDGQTGANEPSTDNPDDGSEVSADDASATQPEAAPESADELFFKHTWELFDPNPAGADAINRPIDEEGYDALGSIVKGKAGEIVYIDRDTTAYHYFAAIRANESCVGCHRTEDSNPDLKVGDLLGVAHVTFPRARSERTIAKNNALLLVMALLTAFLATIAAYAMIRYVIVKPLLHLKEVSDAVYKGDLDQRADIQTNDDFEDLSLAFNRMLRHLVQMQEEQKQIMAEQEESMAQVARANLGLYEANRMKNEFLATVTHELRTPLNSILGFSELLASAPNLSERQAKYATNIDKSGRNLLSLINDILDIAKIEAGKMGRTVTEFELADLIEQERANFEPLASKKSISLTVTTPRALPTLHQDRRKLQQILVNLLSNAIKFTPEGGRVSVRCTHQPNDSPATVTVEIVDSGIGIPLDEQASIFEKFRQAKSGHTDSMTREYEGTGLGLSIVKELCRLLDGEVDLESEFGKGSVFRVCIPISVEPVDEFEIVSPSDEDGENDSADLMEHKDHSASKPQPE